MKDADRTYRILGKLQKAWSNSPEMRMGQLIYAISHEKDGCGAQWYTEDSAFENALDTWLKEKGLS